MFETIHWSVYSKASSRQKVTKMFSILEIAFGTKLNLFACEPYSKGDYNYAISFTSPINQNDLSQAVLETLLISRKIGQSWTVNGPYSVAQEVWYFEGICTKPTFIGADWVMFTLRND